MVQVPHQGGAGQFGLFSEVTIPDSSTSTSALLTDGTEIGEVSFPAPATDLSILLCSTLGLIGSK